MGAKGRLIMRALSVAMWSVVGILLVAPVVRAQDDMPKKPDKESKDDKKADKDDDSDDDAKPTKSPRLPINPLAKAKKGDWSYVVGKVMVGGQKEPEKRVKLLARITKVTDDEVTMAIKDL